MKRLPRPNPKQIVIVHYAAARAGLPLLRGSLYLCHLFDSHQEIHLNSIHPNMVFAISVGVAEPS
jgi:hypothetical protein